MIDRCRLGEPLYQSRKPLGVHCSSWVRIPRPPPRAGDATVMPNRDARRSGAHPGGGGMSTANDESTPPFPVERPAHRPWREGAVTRANELETLRRGLDRGPDDGRTTELSAAVRRHLEIARGTASED